MQKRQVNKPIKINQDKDPKYLGADEARYMLNTERNTGGGGKSNSGKTALFPANELLCETEIDSGEPFFNGAYQSDLTNEVYVFYLTDEEEVYITRVNEDKTCQLVWHGSNDCVGLSHEPEHSIKQWRCYLKYDKFCAHQGGKQLIFTNGIGQIGQIDVEASIETDSFSTAFFNRCYDACAPVQMCVPEPCGVLEGEFVPLEPDQLDLNNRVIDTGLQVRFRHVYYDQRASEWSDISKLIYQDAKACFDTQEGLPRCIKFAVPIGNPLVDKIEIAFSTNNDSQWFLSDTIEKYKPYTSESQKWYERELADLDGYDEDTCTFDYYFCNDKDCAPIDVAQTSRVFNPVPREAQGMFPVKNSLAFYNFKKGNCPLIEGETRKVKISLECSEDNCVQEVATVTAYAFVHDFHYHNNQPVYRFGGSGINDADDANDIAWFGGVMETVLMTGNGAEETRNYNYQQMFSGKTRNFIAYIEGTEYWSEAEQWSADPGFTGKKKAGVLSSFNNNSVYLGYESERRSGKFYFQKFEFKVPKGQKGFIRIVDHLQTTGTGAAQETSTQVLGTIDSIENYSGNQNINGVFNHSKYELYFDTCDGDVEIMEPLIISDHNINNVTGSHSSSSYSGYIKDEQEAAIEGIEIYQDGDFRSKSDHNGFYHFYNRDGQDSDIIVSVRAEQSGAGPFVEVEAVTLSNNYNHTEKDITIDTEYFLDGYYHNFDVLVRDCDSQPVGGIRIAVTGSKYKVSDPVTGIARFKLRNYSTRDRTVTGVVMDGNGCFTLDCADNCQPCMPETLPTLMPAAFTGGTTEVPLSTLLNKTSALVNKKGLKAGGRYKWGVVVKGGCGRMSAVYPVTVMDGSVPRSDSYMNVPKTQDKGQLSFCGINYDASGMVLPEWGECLSIVRGMNNNNYELQWIVDKIERLSDGKMRLTIQSLNDYNAQYNFNTTTVYQYAENDRVEFISNGDGSIFDTESFGALNYLILSPFHDPIVSGVSDAPADYFNQLLIQDNGSLGFLKEGAKIELQRPKECDVQNTGYFEIGVSIPIIEMSGQKVLLHPTGSFETYDTYIVNRQIGKKVSQQFEHKNPSDFWGNALTGISDIGKVHFVNKYENEKRWGRNITINSFGQFNRFGDLEKTLDAPEHGDLTAMVVYDGKVGLGIGEYDNFLFQVSDEFLRMGNDGVVRAAPADSLISDTEPKVVGRFGCQYPHIGSVYFGDGYAVWADVAKGAYVKHDFSTAKDIAEGQMSTYFRKKWAYMELENSKSVNGEDKFRFATGFNSHTSALQLTMKRLSGANINNSKAELLLENETVLIEPRTEEFLTYASYTPNGYSNITLKDGKGCAFLVFDGTAVYIHPVISSVYNRFFGVAVDRVITIAMNQEPDEIKRAVSVEVQDEKMWFVSKVLVDRSAYESEIPPVKFKRREDKWNGSFLSDKNSRGGIHAQGAVATKPRGYFVLVTFVRDNTDGLKYNTTNDVKRVEYSSLDMILFKYFSSAQSGFKGNL